MLLRMLSTNMLGQTILQLYLKRLLRNLYIFVDQYELHEILFQFECHYQYLLNHFILLVVLHQLIMVNRIIKLLYRGYDRQ